MSTKNIFILARHNSPILRLTLELSPKMLDLIAVVVCDACHDLVILFRLMRRRFAMMVLVGTPLEQQTIVTSTRIVVTIAFSTLQLGHCSPKGNLKVNLVDVCPYHRARI